MTASLEANILKRVSCIHYPVQFQGGQAKEVKALIDSRSKVKAKKPAFAAKLGLSIHLTSISAQKIDGSILKTYGITIAGFSIQDKSDRAWFFEETCLLADTNMEVVLGMPFQALSITNIQFDTKSFIWRSYSAAEALPTTKQVELINKYDFAKVVWDKNSETFVVYVAALRVPGATENAGMPIYPDWANQVQVTALQQDKAPTKIPLEYPDYADFFSSYLAMELSENTDINKHAIELIQSKQSPYRPIYSLGPMELETLKAYTKTHLKTGFSRPSISPASAPIFFDKKPDKILRLCIDYQGLNNLTIKNWYPLPLIGKSLDQLGHAKRFTQPDLTSAYNQMRIRESDK